jgi:hypothetical protein
MCVCRHYDAGVALSIDWATCAPLGRLVGACSGGAAQVVPMAWKHLVVTPGT